MQRLFRSLLRYPRLIAFALTLGLIVTAALSARAVVEARLLAATHLIAPLPLHQKNQGMLLQRDAFESPDILPVFGSSELTKPSATRASEMFQSAPTGFQVCPIGSAGNTCLLIATKLAALGEEVRNKKIAVFLSGGWFQRPQVPADHYAGNFSALHAMLAMETPALSEGLRNRLAQRLLDYPETLEAHPALQLRVRSQVETMPGASLMMPLVSLMVRTSAAILDVEDDIQSLWQLHKLKTSGAWIAQPKPMLWNELLASARADFRPSTRKIATWHGPGPSPLDARKRQEFESADKGEWLDLALLLDVINDLHAQALVMAIPLSGDRDNKEGVRSATRHDGYYARIERLCNERHVLVRTMEEHDLDPDFLTDFVSHPSAVGWVHIDHLLDDFWHNRLTSTWTPTN